MLLLPPTRSARSFQTHPDTYPLNANLIHPSHIMSAASSEKLGIMQPGPPGTHRMVLDFSNIILGFDSMHATVERAEKMVRVANWIGRREA